MDSASQSQNPADDTQEQIARLREQVEALMKDRVTPAVADLAGRAESAFNTATGTVRGQTQAVSDQVKENPLLAIGIALAVGWLLGRVTR